MDGRRNRRVEMLETEDIQPSRAFQRKLDDLARSISAGDRDSVQAGVAKRGRGRPPGSRKSKDSPPKSKRPVGRPPKSPRLQAGGLDDLLGGGPPPPVRLVSELEVPRPLMAAGADRYRSKDAWGSRSVSAGPERYKPRATSPQRTPKRSYSPPRMAAAGLDQSASPRWESSAAPKRQPVRIITSDAWGPIAAGGSEDSELRGAAPAYGGDNDPENVLFLGQYLADNYKRISLDQACQEDIDKVDDEDGTIDLEIWYKNKGRWDRMGNEVQSRWAKRLKNRPGSVCSSLVKDLLGFSDSAYAKIRYKFDDTSGYFMEGIYKAKNKNVPKFAVLVEMPTGLALNENLMKGGLGALGLTTVLGGLGAGYLYNQRQKMYKGEVDFAEGIKVVEDAIAAAKREKESIERKGQTQNENKDWVPKSGYARSEKDNARIQTLDAYLASLKEQQVKYKYRLAQDMLNGFDTELNKIRDLKTKGISSEGNPELDNKIKEIEMQQTRARIVALAALREYNENKVKQRNDIRAQDSETRASFETFIEDGINTLVEHLNGSVSPDSIKKLKDDAKYLDELSLAIKPKTAWYRGSPNNLKAITDLKPDADLSAVQKAIYEIFPEIEIKALIKGAQWDSLNPEKKTELLTRLNGGTRREFNSQEDILGVWKQLLNKKYGNLPPVTTAVSTLS